MKRIPSLIPLRLPVTDQTTPQPFSLSRSSMRFAMTSLFSFKVLFIAAALSASFLNPATSYGFEVAFEKDSSLPVVDINIAFKAGSVSDPKGKSGLTYFLGEMLSRGTTARSKEQIDLALDQMGARLRIETRAEALILRGSVLSSKLDNFLDLVAEILTSASFPAREISKLRLETLSNLQDELGNDSRLAGRSFNEFLFQDHPYGNPVHGKPSSIKSFTRADLNDHYERIINQHLLLVVGSGDASPEKINAWTKKVADTRAKALAQKPLVKLVLVASPPAQKDNFRVQIIDKPERTQTQINGGQIGILMTNPDYFPLYVGNHAFGGGTFTATLMTEIRVKRGWSYGAYSSFRHGIQPRSWHFHLFPAEKDTPAALATTLDLVKDLKKNGLSKESFEFAKTSLINNAGFMYNTPSKRVENTLLEKTLHLPDGFMKSYKQNIERVTLSQTNAALANFIKPNQLAISIVGTAKTLKSPIAKALGIEEKEISVKSYQVE